MAPNVTNLIAGPGTLYHADYGATEPADADVDTPPTSPWVDMGGTSGGVTLAVNQELFRMEIDQVVDPVGRRITSRDVTVATSLAEATLDNLARAIGQDPGSIQTGTGYRALDLEGDDPGAEPPYFALLFRGRAPAGHWRHVIIRRAYPTEAVETSYQRGGQTLIPVTFAAHWVSPSVRPVRVVDGISES